jgi:hypothetical protein
MMTLILTMEINFNFQLLICCCSVAAYSVWTFLIPIKIPKRRRQFNFIRIKFGSDCSCGEGAFLHWVDRPRSTALRDRAIRTWIEDPGHTGEGVEATRPSRDVPVAGETGQGWN